MTLHAKSHRRLARRCYAERCAYPLLRLEAPVPEFGTFVRAMEALTARLRAAETEMQAAICGGRLCALAGLPMQDGAL